MVLAYNQIIGIVLIVLGLCVLFWGIKRRFRQRRLRVPAKYKNYAAVLKAGFMESMARLVGLGLIVVGAAAWFLM